VIKPDHCHFLFNISEPGTSDNNYYNETYNFLVNNSGLRLINSSDSLETVLYYLENQNNFKNIDKAIIHILCRGEENKVFFRLLNGEACRTLELPNTNANSTSSIQRSDLQFFFSRKWPAGLNEQSIVYLHGCAFGNNACLTHTFWELLGTLATLHVPKMQCSYSLTDKNLAADTAVNDELFDKVDYSFFKLPETAT
jgi:hypothetical protein